MSPTIFDRNTKVLVWFGSDVVDDTAFILDDSLLDDADVLTGDTGTDIAAWVYDIVVTRGRSRELDEIQAGVCTVRLRNVDRAFDPLNVEYLLDEDGTPILTEDGEYILLDGSTMAPALTPGKRLRVELYGQTIYDGTTEDWNVIYEPRRRTDASVAAVDHLGSLARRELDEWSPPVEQWPGDRITTVLNRTEVSLALTRDIDDGVTVLQGDTVTDGTNALTYLQKVAKTDYGMLFASRDNVLTFRDRHSRITETPSLSFSTIGDGLPIHGLELTVGSELLHNRVTVDRGGDGDPMTADDTESQTVYGIRTLSLSAMLMGYNREARSLAEFLVGLYKDPTQRIAAVKVNVSALSSQAERARVAALDLGSVVSVTAQPFREGVTFVQESVVEGIEHTVGHGQAHMMLLRLSPVAQFGSVFRSGPVFLLDDPVFGVLDSDAAVLAFL